MKAAFTIVTNNYISYAKTLGDSVKMYNPDYAFFIGLLGKKDNLSSSVNLDDFFVIEIGELNDTATIDSMQSKYNAFELSCALKPYFAEHILLDNTIKRLKYLDSDMMLFNSFDKEIEANTTSSIFLTPHFFNSVDPTENTTNDATLLRSGIFNAGYFEIANNIVAHRFLNWWKDRLSKYCFSYKSPFVQIFVDQSWLNLVPVYFKDTFIIQHLGYNVSFYNLHERKISNDNNYYFINGNEPMIFFHYTGYKYYQHGKVSMYNPKYNYENTPFLKSICDRYQKELINNDIELTLPSTVINTNIRNPLIAFVINCINKILMKFLKIKIVKANEIN